MKQLIYELKKRTGECMDISVNYLDAINKTSAGKFRSVISELDINEANQNIK